MEELTHTHWVLLAIGSLIMGMSKGGIPGAGNLTIAIFALVLEDALGLDGVPLSVGLLLPVLISADLTATIVYRRHADWHYILRLLPFFLIGTALGWWVFDYFQGGDERVRLLKMIIGTILLGMTFLHFLIKFKKKSKSSETDDTGKSGGSIGLGILFGTLGGVATMLANAAGPIAQLYLLVMGLPKYAFIGTSAWLFLIVNLCKIPFMIDLEIITTASISVSVWMFIPAMIGAATAPLLVKYLNQALFERFIWFFIVLAGLRMLV
tara:strand:+ start:3941 stop:4738 length:798 start_codon:yes stop_codon:yes gene_type:complete